ncbi:MAG: VWA domain-containing protein [Oscillospiraceae bacterium]
MRNKVRKSLAFLLALALVVSVMSGLGLSVSAEQESNTPGTEEVQQQDKTEAGAAPSEVKAEEEAAKSEEKPVQEEKADEQKTEAKENADKPAEKQEKATPKAGENVQTATIGTGDKTVTVKTTAAAGVLPEGAKLVVKKLANQDQAYQDAESTLKDSQVTYDDFLALDVGFEVNGKEVEPEAGSVQVQFELGAGLLPETADTSTLAVQHLTDGKAETVADAGAVTAGDVTVKNQVVKADFEVQSFSTFTITWSGWSTYFQVTVHYVDENGGEIYASHSDMSISDGDTIEFADVVRAINGYTYQGAHYDTYSGDVVTKMTADVVTKMTAREEDNLWYTTRYLTFYNGNTQVEKLTRSAFGGTQTAEVYLVYKADGTGGGGSSGRAITEEQSLTREKYVTPNKDGSYDLSLTVSGAKGTQANPAKVDVVYVLDVSGSMAYNMMNNRGSSNERLEQAKTAISTMTDALANNQQIDARFSLVTFSGSRDYSQNDTYNDAKPQQTWTENANTLTNKLPKSASGGTNYEAGLKVANELLGTARNGATTVVVFVSDGDPTYYYDVDGHTVGKGENYDVTAMTKAQNVVKQMSANMFFTVGVGPKNNYLKLKNLTNSVKSGVTTKNYDGNDSTALQKAFDDITAQITTFLCTDVTVIDVLSENVQMVMGSDNKPKKLVVTVKKKSGATVRTPGGITANYYADQKKIVMDFPNAYELDPEYTYIVTATIEATEKAYENYRANGNDYSDEGETGTGATSAGQSGVFSNEDGEAKVTYTYNGKPDEAEYPMPVIQLHPGTLIVKKSITGDLTDAEKTALVNKMTVDVTIKGNETKVPLSAFTPGDDGTYTFTFNGLSPNTAYSVTESNADVEGYELTTTPSPLPVSGSVAGDATETVHITNTYTPSNRTITLRKVVTGNMGDKDRSFTFSATKATLGETSLKDGKTTTITAKVGETVTITEDDYTSDGYTTTASATNDVTDGKYEDHSYTFTVTKDMSESTIITFTNTKTIQPPNGITTTIAPYAIMVVLAAGAGVYFVYSRRRRNR